MPIDKQTICEALLKHQEFQKEIYNKIKKAKDLPELFINQHNVITVYYHDVIMLHYIMLP